MAARSVTSALYGVLLAGALAGCKSPPSPPGLGWRHYGPPDSDVDAMLGPGFLAEPGSGWGHYRFPRAQPKSLREHLEERGVLPAPEAKGAATSPDGRDVILPGGTRVPIDPDAPPPPDDPASDAFRYGLEQLERDLDEVPPRPDRSRPGP